MNNSSQIFESYVPVYDTIPEKWESARPLFVEIFKAMSNAINIREIGWLLDEEYLSGQAFIPGLNNPQEFRSVLRKVVNIGPLLPAPTVNQTPHGITFDANFTLISLVAAATNPITLVAEPIPNGNGDTIVMDATNINTLVTAAWPRAYAIVTYIQEL